jgi:hypothetical protein
MVAAISDYSERIEAELRAYNEVEQVHDLPLVHTSAGTRTHARH